MCTTQIETSKGRESDKEIDFRFGERPAIRDCRVKAPSKRGRFARDLDTSRRTGVSVIMSEFILGLFFYHEMLPCSVLTAPALVYDTGNSRAEDHPHRQGCQHGQFDLGEF